MSSLRQGTRGAGIFSVRRWIAVALVLGGASAAAALVTREILPSEGVVARGVMINGAALDADGDGDRERGPREAARREAARLLGRRIELRLAGERLLDVTPADLGAVVDEAATAEHLASIGRQGDLFARLDESLEAREGRVNVTVRARVPVETLAEKLDRIKEERDTAPKASKLDFETGTATPHAPGRYLDVYATASAIERAIDRGEASIELPMLEIAPRASSDRVAAIDVHEVVAKFETRFGYLGGQAGRAQNVTRAASGMNGVVLMPGEVVSFNENVGARSLENGFAHAPEIYKGEMREGVGGGTCQVASTLHAAAFMGGIDIVERINHSRPSGYIRMGLDATVVYPTVDLKLRNPYDFPVVVRASIDRGLLVFELRGREKPVTVELNTATTGVEDFKRKVEEDPILPEGKIVLKQKGIRGYTIKKFRTIHANGGKDRVEVTTDVYPQTFEIYRVAPGTDVETALPPLPSEAPKAEEGKPIASEEAAAPEGTTTAARSGGASG
jgi:vancomycin resistance protein YoaR